MAMNEPQPAQVCPICKTVIMASQPVHEVDGRQVHVACTIRKQPQIGPHSGQ
jgi:hypothetical protein